MHRIKVSNTNFHCGDCRYLDVPSVAMNNRTPRTAPSDPKPAQAAAELQVDIKTIYRRIADGTLPAYRIKGSRLIRIRREDLDALKVPLVTGGAA